MTAKETRPLDRNVLVVCLLILALGVALPAPGAKAKAITLAGLSFGSNCLFKNLTGFDCPFCGMTRSTVSLLHGNLAEAIGFHPLGPAFMVFLIFQIVYRVGRLSGARAFAQADLAPAVERMAPFVLLVFAFLARWVIRLGLELIELVSSY